MTRYYTIDEVAELLQLSKATVYRMVSEGDIPVVKVRSLMRVPESAMEERFAEQLNPKGAA